MVDLIRTGKLTLSTLIYSNNYYLTTFDLYLMLNKYKISSIFISQKPLIIANKEANEFICYGSRENNFIFILTSALGQKKIPVYKLILNEDNSLEFNISIDEKFNNAFIKQMSVANYLDNYQKLIKKLKQPKEIKEKKQKKLKLISEKSSEEIKEKISEELQLLQQPLQETLKKLQTSPLQLSTEEFFLLKKPKKKTKKALQIIQLKGKKEKQQKTKKNK